MLVDSALILMSLLLLFLGAEGLVRGSSSLALRFGISPLIVGLTIVAFGTSSPELVVSIKAALSQQGDISIGNVVGSNIFNIGVILGITAIVCPIPVNLRLLKTDAPIALAAAVLAPVFLLDGILGRTEGFILLLAVVVYNWSAVHRGRIEAIRADQLRVAQFPTPPQTRHWFIDAGFIIGGLAVLIFGSRLLVQHASSVARLLGVSEAMIGLTIVAVGTSVPELSTSLVAAIRKQPDIAIGNVIGSNIFNLLAILGVASLVSPLHAPGIAWIDYGMMVWFTLLLIPLLYTGRLLHRLEGVLLFTCYIMYVFVLLV